MPKKKIFISAFLAFILGLLLTPFTLASDPVPWQEFKKAYGENWTVKWNEKTGMPHRVYNNKKPGPEKAKSLKMARGAVSLPESEFENTARIFIEQNNGLFRIGNKDLLLLRSKKHGPVFYVTFKQLFKNIPVYNSRIDFQFNNAGDLLLFGADIYPDINIPGFEQISEENAIMIARDDVGFDPEKDKIAGTELLIYPEETKEGFKYYLAWRLEVDIKKPRGNWIYFIDAGNGKIIMKYNDIKNFISGKITGHILPLKYDDIPQSVPMPYESVYADLYSVSDKDGNYAIPTYPGAYSLTSRLEGKYLKVTSALGDDAYYTAAVNDGDYSADIIWDTGLTSGRYDEMNVYYHSMKMHDYIKNIDPDFTGVDYCMPAVVGLNDPDTINSAYYDWLGINFGMGDDINYKSAALSADIIYHEYSHGVNHNLYKQEGGSLPYIDGTESGAMEEGFASYWACSLHGSSKFGVGFYPEGSFFEVDNNLIYPYDLKDEVHDDGWIIAGAMWRLRKLLGQTAADYLFHFARYGLPVTFEDFFLEVLMKNDDNADLSDGTPNSLQIYSAFGSHGISGLQIESISIDDRIDGNDNGIMNPGEKLDLVVVLGNKMFENAENVLAVLSTEDPYIDIISGQADFGGMIQGEKKSGSFTILLNSSAPAGNLISFNLKVSNKKGYTFDLPFYIGVSDYIEKKWRIENITSVTDFPDYAGNRLLGRDKDGNLFLMYGYKSLSFASYDGDKWTTSVYDGKSKDPYNYSLVMANNIPHLVYNYTTEDSRYNLIYARLNNGQWETEIVNSNDSSQFRYPSLAFNPGDSPQISYAGDDYIGYSYQSAGIWVTESIDTSCFGSYTSIGAGSNNAIHVAYYDLLNNALKYAKRSGSAWQSGFIDTMLDVGKCVDLVIGTDGNPHFCYYDSAKGNLKYARWNGYSWKLGIVDMDGDAGLYPSMAVDSKNLPHIVYYDKTDGVLKYAYYNGKFWEISKIDDSGDAGYYPSIVIDDKGLLSVAYYSKCSDGNNYLKFASSSFMTSPIYLQPGNNSIADTDVTLRWMMDGLKAGEVFKYDVYLDTAGAYTRIAENISDNSYRITNLEYGKVYYWRIISRDEKRFEFKCAINRFKTPIGGDVNKNGIVDGDDLVSFSGSFGSTKDYELYNTISDIDRNGRIDGADLMFLGMNFGKSY